MKKTFTLSIPKPCHEKWEEFNPTTLGGFCSSCQKEVVDFTTWDEDRIKSYFKNRSQTSCGRFYPEQLKNYTLDEAPKFNFLRWTYIPLISLVMLLFSRNAQAQKMGKTRIERTIKTGEAVPVIGDTVHVKVIKGIVRSKQDNSHIPGVNVLLKGTSIGTSTDVEGRFSLSIVDSKSDDVLIFSFVGFRTVEHPVENLNSLSVSMSTEPVVLGGVDGRFTIRDIWWSIKGWFH